MPRFGIAHLRGGGNNRFVAVVQAAGATGATSDVAVVQLGSAGGT